jgi:tRNA A37 N6-isopentenylltransferase MiaA
MRAAERDAKRKAAIEAEARVLVPQAERDALWRQSVAMARKLATPRRVKMTRALELYNSLLKAVVEQRTPKPKLAVAVATVSGLIKPRSSLLITPEEARAISRRFP